MNSAIPPNSQRTDSQKIPAPRFHWGTRVLLPVLLVFAFVVLFAGSLISSLSPMPEVRAIPVIERPSIDRTEEVDASVSVESAVTVQAAGWIEPDPFPVYATALTNGSIDQVLFLEGQAVKKGQVLARLIDDDAKLALKRAEADARAAQESLDENIEPTRKEAVAAAIVDETSASLALARAELKREEALLWESQRVQGRRDELIKTDVISSEELDTAKTEALAQQARVNVAKQKVKQLSAQLERAKVEHLAAKHYLETLTEERRRLDLALVALDEARLRVERLEIRSPIDGVVMQRLAEPGKMVMTGSDNPDMPKVAQLYDPSRLQVRVDVPLADAAKISASQRAEVLVEVLPDQTFQAEVTRITNLADIQKNTLEVKVALKDPPLVLKPDMLARVRFLAPDAASSAPVVIGSTSVFAPSSAIADGEAWVVTNYDGESGIAEPREVKLTGASHDDYLEVADGLLPGDLLIDQPAETLKSGQRVRVRMTEKE